MSKLKLVSDNSDKAILWNGKTGFKGAIRSDCGKFWHPCVETALCKYVGNDTFATKEEAEEACIELFKSGEVTEWL